MLRVDGGGLEPAAICVIWVCFGREHCVVTDFTLIDVLIEWSGSALAAALPGVISFFVTLSVPDTQLRCRCVFEFASRDGLTEHV